MKNLDLSTVSPRTIKRWKAAGAPLEDDSRLRAWLAGRKNLPQSIRDQIVSVSVPEVDTKPEPVSGVSGAAEALARLEREEVAAHQRLQAALAAGDPLSIKSERDGWLKISESLRRYDLLVEQSRRDAGELMPMSQVRELIRAWIGWVPLGNRQEAEELAGAMEGRTAVEIYEGIRRLLNRHFFERLTGWIENTKYEALAGIIRAEMDASWQAQNAKNKL